MKTALVNFLTRGVLLVVVNVSVEEKLKANVLRA
jgi:hypothetical protein